MHPTSSLRKSMSIYAFPKCRYITLENVMPTFKSSIQTSSNTVSDIAFHVQEALPNNT